MGWEPGQWKVICDVCGWEFLAKDVKKRWDGLIVCDKDFELDHPQKYIRARSDPKPLPADFVRTEPEDHFIGVCTLYTQQGFAGIGVAGCCIASKNNNFTYSEYGPYL